MLFVNDHLGFPGGVTHGSTTYLSTVLPRFRAAAVRPHLAICREWHPAVANFEPAAVPVAFFGRSKWDPRALTDILRLARTWRADILHLNGKKSHFLGRLAARRLRIPAILHLHLLYDPRPRALQPWLARRTALAIGVSNALTRQAVDAFRIPPDRAVTVYNGLDLDRFRLDHTDGTGAELRAELGIPADAPLLAVVGRITRTPDKGQRYAIETLVRVRRELEDAVMVIVGDGPARAECEALARSLRVDGAVTFTGQRSDVERFWAAADVGLVPSVVDEALAYAAVEAQAAGRPVVAFDGGGTPEAVLDGETGFIVPNGDVNEMTRRTIELLTDPALRRRMGAAGRDAASRFDPGAHVDRLEALYRVVLDSGT